MSTLSSLLRGARGALRHTKAAWHTAFQRHLLATNCITGAGLFLLADCIEQMRERRRQKKQLGVETKYDYARSGRMLGVGLLGGPPHHYYYLYLDKCFPHNTLRTVGAKILAEQFLAAPLFGVIFFYSLGLMEGKSMGQCWAEFKHKFPMVYLFDWMLWPPAQYINFRYVPAQYRVLYVSVVTFFWDIFLSYIKHYDQHKKES